MEGSNLDRVLNCPNLPSLPGAAMSILEQTRDPKVTLDQIAKTIQTDPALATKVLKTVNSSYYGLSQPCSTISRAIGFLGLNTVKSVVLGFSLVDSSKRAAAGGGFDLSVYWRRAVFAAAGARLVAENTRAADRDEAFLGALVQDIGMLAAFAALKDGYTGVLSQAGPDHDRLGAAEQTALGFTHMQAGSQLAQKWRLPEQIVACIRHHHDAEKSPPSSEALVRVIAMGGLLAGVLTLADRAEKLRDLVNCGHRWLGLDKEQCIELVERTAERGGELGRAMEVKTGEAPDIEAILGEAGEAMLEHQVHMQQEALTLRQTSEELARQTVTDGLTGAKNRKHFDTELSRMFAEAAAARGALGVLFIDGDKFKSVNDTHGHKAGDAVLVELANRMRQAVGDAGTVCRYGGEEFAVLLPGQAMSAARQTAERVRAAVAAQPIDVRGTGAKADALPITVSVGVAALQSGTGFSTAAELVQAADQAVYAAKRTGRNRVCAFGDPETAGAPAGDHQTAPAPIASSAPAGPRPTASSPAAAPPTGAGKGLTVMVVEDDPLSAHLLEVLLSKRHGARVLRVGSGEEALRALGAASTAALPNLILCDRLLPGMNGEMFVRSLRERAPLRAIPVVILSASTLADDRSRCLGAGAAAYITKAEFAKDLDGWTAKLVGMCSAKAAA